MSLIVIVALAAGGALAGRIFPALQKAGRVLSFLQSLCLFAVLAAMGVKIGLDEEIFQSIPDIGLTALAFAALSAAGSVLTVWLLTIPLRKKKFEGAAEEEHSGAALPMTLAILGTIGAGVIAGRLLCGKAILSAETVDTIINIGLMGIVLGAGIDFGRRKEAVEVLKKNGLGLLLVPLGVIVGSIAFSAAGGLLLGVSPAGSAAVGAGLGWYSYSGVAIATVNVELGAVAFLANILREMITLAAAPVVAKKLGGLCTVALGGATVMDTTLPVIVRSAGSAYGPVSLVSGMLTTMAVPLLVGLFLPLI